MSESIETAAREAAASAWDKLRAKSTELGYPADDDFMFWDTGRFVLEEAFSRVLSDYVPKEEYDRKEAYARHVQIAYSGVVDKLVALQAENEKLRREAAAMQAEYSFRLVEMQEEYSRRLFEKNQQLQALSISGTSQENAN